MLYLNESDVKELVGMSDAMDAVEKCFRAQGEGRAPNQPRRRAFVPKGTMHVMFGGLVDEDGGYLGLKAYTTFPGVGVRFIFLLWDADTSEMLALIEANVLGQMRTGAASGVAAKYMARADAKQAGLIGTGWQARAQLEALCLARELETVKIYSRSAAKREKFVGAMREKVGAELVAVESAGEAVRGSRLVCAITSAREPVFDGADLAPGTTVIAAGSNRVTHRELDDETFRRAAKGRIVTDSLKGAEFESGDLAGAARANVIQWGQVSEIGLIAAGVMPGRASDEEINLFLSQGVAIEDVALGAEIYRRAKERGAGAELPVEGFFKKRT